MFKTNRYFDFMILSLEFINPPEDLGARARPALTMFDIAEHLKVFF